MYNNLTVYEVLVPVVRSFGQRLLRSSAMQPCSINNCPSVFDGHNIYTRFCEKLLVD
jgi:hypothetical protein